MSTVTQRYVVLGLCIKLHLQSILKIKCFFEDVSTKIYVDMDLLMKWVFMRRRDSSDKRVHPTRLELCSDSVNESYCFATLGLDIFFVKFNFVKYAKIDAEAES